MDIDKFEKARELKHEIEKLQSFLYGIESCDMFVEGYPVKKIKTNVYTMFGRDKSRNYIVPTEITNELINVAKRLLADYKKQFEEL